jgi:hypothetical protein
MVEKFFRVLSDPARLRLLEFLLHHEDTVTECVDRAVLSQDRVSARFAHYRAADPRLADLVMLARSLAVGDSAALAGCVRIASAGRGTAAGSGPIPALRGGGDLAAAGGP